MKFYWIYFIVLAIFTQCQSSQKENDSEKNNKEDPKPLSNDSIISINNLWIGSINEIERKIELLIDLDLQNANQSEIEKLAQEVKILSETASAEISKIKVVSKKVEAFQEAMLTCVDESKNICILYNENADLLSLPDEELPIERAQQWDSSFNILIESYQEKRKVVMDKQSQIDFIQSDSSKKAE